MFLKNSKFCAGLLKSEFNKETSASIFVALQTSWNEIHMGGGLKPVASEANKNIGSGGLPLGKFFVTTHFRLSKILPHLVGNLPLKEAMDDDRRLPLHENFEEQDNFTRIYIIFEMHDIKSYCILHQ